ncbi:ATP-binding protein [Streptomyces sp. SBT349]|uniref:ATP-binding protein n=1 Tax=Streptomyces sp. SBT349 TaxID=1580539 RepID=UPI00069F4C10|nr:ATP-binding protein [Streptomyces sp. SBT349]
MESPAPAFEAELDLAESGASTARARAFARQLLLRHGYRGLVDDVVLVVSELVANALRHGRGAPRLRLSVTAVGVRVEVADSGRELPVSLPPGPHGGRGLHMVERLGRRWGFEDMGQGKGQGKVVWCELRA